MVEPGLYFVYFLLIFSAKKMSVKLFGFVLLTTMHIMCILVESRDATCAKRVYLSRAEQTDENGLKCWDNVKVPSCGGRCDSREV